MQDVGILEIDSHSLIFSLQIHSISLSVEPLVPIQTSSFDVYLINHFPLQVQCPLIENRSENVGNCSGACYLDAEGRNLSCV